MFKYQRLVSTVLLIALLLAVVGLSNSLFDDSKKPFTYNSIEGKAISFMGDSITTYEGWNNNVLYNSTIGSNAVWYNASRIESVDFTYWKQTVDELDLKLCVNNAWSGSKVTGTGTSAACMTRAQNLHNDITGETPEIIVVYIGINDYRASVEVGSFTDVGEIFDSSANTYISDCSLFAPAYATMVHKMKAAYPEADIYLCNIPYYFDTELLVSYNTQIKAIADTFGCVLVDFYSKSDFTPDTLSSLTIDNLHPNKIGMDTMTECIMEAIKNNSK